MTTQNTEQNAFAGVMEHFQKTAETTLKLQQDMLEQWVSGWPQMPPAQVGMGTEQMRSLQKKWSETVTELVRRHRDTIDKQYQAAVESLEQAFNVAQASDPAEFRERTSALCQKSLECMRQIAESQVEEFQRAMTKWGELFAETGKK